MAQRLAQLLAQLVIDASRRRLQVHAEFTDAPISSAPRNPGSATDTFLQY
jgi:hypothetical protein